MRIYTRIYVYIHVYIRIYTLRVSAQLKERPGANPVLDIHNVNTACSHVFVYCL